MHNIYNDKFYSYRTPAWHGLGYVSSTPLQAIEAGRLVGIPAVTAGGVYDGQGKQIPGYKLISGQESGKEAIPFSIVSEDYQEITHAGFLAAWDQAVKAPVETLGLLGKGENMFLTTRLPQSMTVRGDYLENYLLAANILSGTEADFVRVTPVRVVCQNTLNLSASNYSEEYRVIHTSDAATQVARWLEQVWGLAAAKVRALEEAFTILAKYSLRQDDSKTVLETTYPSLPPPLADEHTDDGLNTLAEWERDNKRQAEHREWVHGLANGAGVGSTTDAASGTAWGLWNAVVEYEDFGKPRRRSASALFGAGAARKQIAFDTLMQLAAS